MGPVAQIVQIGKNRSRIAHSFAGSGCPPFRKLDPRTHGQKPGVMFFVEIGRRFSPTIQLGGTPFTPPCRTVWNWTPDTLWLWFTVPLLP